jgi:hypothetical protein
MFSNDEIVCNSVISGLKELEWFLYFLEINKHADQNNTV